MTARSGLYDAKDPHGSFTQLDAANKCLAWHKATYEQGRKGESRTAKWGRITHAAIADVNRALVREGEKGIVPEDIEHAKRNLIGFHDYGLYAAFCDWLERYAEHANGERARILGVEVEVESWLTIGEIKANPKRVWIMDLDRKEWTRGTAKRAAIKMVGRIDRLDRGTMGGDAIIRDFKTWGSIPTKEDLQGSFQFGLYNLALRQPANAERFGLNPLADYQAAWQSIFHGGSPVTVGMGVKEAEAADTYARDLVRRLIQRVDRPETFHRHCIYCPRSERMECKTFKGEIAGTGKAATVLRPTAGEYVKVADRLAVLSGLQDRMRDRLRVRLEGNAGKPIEEEGARAMLVNRKGGLNEQYLAMSRDELIAALTREARTDVVVRRTT